MASVKWFKFDALSEYLVTLWTFEITYEPFNELVSKAVEVTDEN